MAPCPPTIPQKRKKLIIKIRAQYYTFENWDRAQAKLKELVNAGILFLDVDECNE